MNLDLPDVIHVGPYRYAVEIEPAAFVGEDHTTLCGSCSHNDGRIRIMRCHPHRMFVTFWHEVLHAINDVAATQLSEDTVERLAPVLVGVLIDNGYVDEP